MRLDHHLEPQVGVLALPYCFSYLTWSAGPLLLALSCATSLYTSYLLACLHQDSSGTRYNSYLELGRAVLGAPFTVTVHGQAQSLTSVGNTHALLEALVGT